MSPILGPRDEEELVLDLVSDGKSRAGRRRRKYEIQREPRTRPEPESSPNSDPNPGAGPKSRSP